MVLKRSKATVVEDFDAEQPSSAAAPPKKAMGQFDWTDPLRLSMQLSEEETLVAQTAQAYAKEELLPGIVAANRNETFDRNIMTQMGELGLLVGGRPGLPVFPPARSSKGFEKLTHAVLPSSLPSLPPPPPAAGPYHSRLWLRWSGVQCLRLDRQCH